MAKALFTAMWRLMSRTFDGETKISWRCDFEDRRLTAPGSLTKDELQALTAEQFILVDQYTTKDGRPVFSYSNYEKEIDSANVEYDAYKLGKGTTTTLQKGNFVLD